ncbi:MAG: hypothetical protein O3A01_05770 [bacterium]|nr:hypothetical protein [bacterium]
MRFLWPKKSPLSGYASVHDFVGAAADGVISTDDAMLQTLISELQQVKGTGRADAAAAGAKEVIFEYAEGIVADDIEELASPAADTVDVKPAHSPDGSRGPVTALFEQLKAQALAGNDTLTADVTNENLFALVAFQKWVFQQRLSGVPLPHNIQVILNGTVGVFSLNYLSDLNVTITGNANENLACAQSGGSIVVQGNVSTTFRYGATAGTGIVVGNADSRAAALQKGGITGIGGHSFELGYNMAGGTVVALGKTDGRIGPGMAAGNIFLLKETNPIIDSQLGQTPTGSTMTCADAEPKDVGEIRLVLHTLSQNGHAKAAELLALDDAILASQFHKVTAPLPPYDMKRFLKTVMGQRISV